MYCPLFGCFFCVLCFSPGVSPEIYKLIFEKFAGAGREAELENVQSYDPSTEVTEITSLEEFGKIREMMKIEMKEIRWEVACAGVLMVSGGVLMKFLGRSLTEILLAEFLVEIAFLGKLLVQKITKMCVMGEFQKQELTRICGNTVSGNVTNLMIQIGEKLQDMEVRSEKLLGSKGAFARHFVQELVEVPWISQQAANEKFGYMVAQFLEIKSTRAQDPMPEQVQQEFTQELRDMLMPGVELHRAAGRLDLAQFFEETLLGQIEEIALEYHWFDRDLVWKF